MMTLLHPEYASSVPFSRPTESPFGDVTETPLGDTRVVVSIQNAAIGGEEGPDFTQSGVVFTPRNLDRRAGDIFVYNGATYTLVGSPRGDHLHPFTGSDFGWVAHTVKRLA